MNAFLQKRRRVFELDQSIREQSHGISKVSFESPVFVVLIHRSLRVA